MHKKWTQLFSSTIKFLKNVKLLTLLKTKIPVVYSENVPLSL